MLLESAFHCRFNLIVQRQKPFPWGGSCELFLKKQRTTGSGVELRFWPRQGKEKRLPARKKDSWQGFKKSA